MKRLRLILLFISVSMVARPQISKVWVADNGDGTYKNPVIHADYSDPDAIRVGDNYYMIASSFNHVPGLPVLHSKDLVNWTLTSHALKKQPPYDAYDKVQHGAGVWAPSLRYHNGEFYIYYPDPDFGIYLTKAKSITGPWSEPILVQEGRGLIDPCPLWDDDGKAYLVHAYAGSRAGIKSIIVVKEMNREGTKIIGNAVLVYDGHDADPTIEGPKFYKRNGWYYIFAPAGGVSTGWQTVLRSKKIYGPYETKVVMDQGSTKINGPHQGTWVTTQTGEDWFLHFQDKEAYGRVVHLQPMKWINDWPVIGIDNDGDGKGEPVLNYKKPNVGKTHPVKTVADSDEFNSTRLGLQWQWQANPKEGWAYTTPAGFLRMFSVHLPDSANSLWNYPAILAQKFPAEEFTVSVKVNFKPRFENEKFGLVVFGSDYASVSIVKKKDGIYLVQSENTGADKNAAEKEIAAIKVNSREFILKVKISKAAVCDFGYESEDGSGTFLKTFTARPGRWVGAKIGLFCTRTNLTNDAGFADVNWVRFEQGKKKD